MVDFTPILERLPSILPREEDSVIKRYLDGYSDESNDFGEELEDIRNSRFVDKAVGGDLDEIGKQYGAIGKRAGRDDESYRAYLKSLVQVFRFRGTIPGIKSAVAAGLDIDPGLEESPGQDDIEIFEHFNDEPPSSDPEKFLEYSIELYDWTPHEVATITELAELSDASVSRLRKIEYKPAFEEVQFDDTPSVGVSRTLLDEFTSDDDRFVDQNLFSEDEQVSSADVPAIDANLTTFDEDSVLDDTPLIDENLSTIVEGAVMADTIASLGLNTTEINDASASDDDISSVEPSDKNAHFWEDDQSTDVTGWDFFEWTEIVELSVTSPIDTAFSDDALSIDTNKFAVADASSADDAASAILSPDGLAVEDAGSGDTVTGTSFTSVAWDTNSWESFDWTKEHN
jgi:hypothetical protein